MTKMKQFMAATAVAALSAGGASALPVGDILIDSVAGVWTSTAGAPTSGLGSSQISWGTPASSAGQSSYLFVGTAPPQQGPFAENEVFDLGEFTHFNFPIFAPSITFAELEVTILGSIAGEAFSLTSVFDFDHFETPNGAVPCPGGDVGECGDIVTPTLNVGASESVNVDGIEYFISVTGFDIGSFFLTAEGQTNSATLQGVFTANVPNVIPLPAAGWMLLAGVGGLAALRRRQKRADV